MKVRKWPHTPSAQEDWLPIQKVPAKVPLTRYLLVTVGLCGAEVFIIAGRQAEDDIRKEE